jgi:hypothetical protein
VERRREERPGERTGLVRKVTNVALSEIAGDAGAPFAAVTSGLPTTRNLSSNKSLLPDYRLLAQNSVFRFSQRRFRNVTSTDRASHSYAQVSPVRKRDDVQSRFIEDGSFR